MLTFTRLCLFLLCLFFTVKVMAIELVVNGTTYHIDHYKIEHNGQRIVIEHNTLKDQISSKYNCKKAPLRKVSSQPNKTSTEKSLRKVRHFFKELSDELTNRLPAGEKKQEREKIKYQ